jgi:hypothetical protein
VLVELRQTCMGLPGPVMDDKYHSYLTFIPSLSAWGITGKGTTVATLVQQLKVLLVTIPEFALRDRSDEARKVDGYSRNRSSVTRLTLWDFHRLVSKMIKCAAENPCCPQRPVSHKTRGKHHRPGQCGPGAGPRSAVATFHWGMVVSSCIVLPIIRRC